MVTTTNEMRRNPKTGKLEKTGRQQVIGYVPRSGGGYERGVAAVADSSGKVVERTPGAVVGKSLAEAKQTEQAVQQIEARRKAARSIAEQTQSQRLQALMRAQRSIELVRRVEAQRQAQEAANRPKQPGVVSYNEVQGPQQPRTFGERVYQTTARNREYLEQKRPESTAGKAIFYPVSLIAESGFGLAEIAANPGQTARSVVKGTKEFASDPKRVATTAVVGAGTGAVILATGGVGAAAGPAVATTINAGLGVLGTYFITDLFRGGPEGFGRKLPEAAVFVAGAGLGGKVGSRIVGERFTIPGPSGDINVRTVGTKSGQTLLTTIRTPRPSTAQQIIDRPTSQLTDLSIQFGRVSPRNAGRIQPTQLRTEFQQPATAPGGRVSQSIIEYTPTEAARIGAAQRIAATNRASNGQRVRDVLFDVEGLQNVQRTSRSIETFAAKNRGEIYGSSTTLQLPKQFQMRPGDVDLRLPLTTAQAAPKVKRLAETLKRGGEDVQVSQTNELIVEFRRTGAKLVEVKASDSADLIGLEPARPGFLGVEFGGDPVAFGKARAIRAGDQASRKASGAVVVTPDTTSPLGAGPTGKPARALKDVAGFVNQAEGLIAIDSASINPLRVRRAARTRNDLNEFLETYTPAQREIIRAKQRELVGERAALENPRVASRQRSSSPLPESTSTGVIIGELSTVPSSDARSRSPSIIPSRSPSLRSSSRSPSPGSPSYTGLSLSPSPSPSQSSSSFSYRSPSPSPSPSSSSSSSSSSISSYSYFSSTPQTAVGLLALPEGRPQISKAPQKRTPPDTKFLPDFTAVFFGQKAGKGTKRVGDEFALAGFERRLLG